MRVKVIPPDNIRRAASAMVGEISENFEVRREYFVVLALQQALEELHYRDSLYGRQNGHTCLGVSFRVFVSSAK